MLYTSLLIQMLKYLLRTLIGDGNIVICEEQEYYSDKL